MDKRNTAEIFRERLRQLVDNSGLSRAKFATAAGLDRSTLSQLLDRNHVRLPRSETLARIADRHTVSLDWLLGLSQQQEIAADVVAHLTIEPDVTGPADERLANWHSRARGMKVRYVPATLPDQVKSADLIDYEASAIATPGQAVWSGNARARISHAERTDSEIDVCSSYQSVHDLAVGAGIWRDFPRKKRTSALLHIAKRTEALYPTQRWFLFDGLAHYSAPYTVFGHRRGAIYLGDMFFVFTGTDHIRELIRHFDRLIRSASVQPHETAAYVAALADTA